MKPSLSIFLWVCALHLPGALPLRAQDDPLLNEIKKRSYVTQENFPDPMQLGPKRIALNADGTFKEGYEMGRHYELGRIGSVFQVWVPEIIFKDGIFQLSDIEVPIATRSMSAKPLPNGSLTLTAFKDTRFNDPRYYPARPGKVYRMLEGDTFSFEATPIGLKAASDYEFETHLQLEVETKPRAPLSPFNALLPAPDTTVYEIPSEGVRDVCPSAVGEIPVLARGCGEYVLSLYRKPVPYSFFGEPEGSGEMPEVELDRATVQVWPRATMWMGGMEKYLIGVNPEPAKIVDRLPPVSLTLRNLYPDSRTVIWLTRHESKAFASAPLEAYKIDVLDFNLGPYFNPVVSPDVIHPQQPQNRALVFDHFDKYITTSGFWWIQVRTVNALHDPEEENKQLGGDLIPMTITGSTIPVDFKFEVARIRTRGQITTAE